MADEYKDPNTDIMKALSKAVDAATGETGTQYEYKNPNTDVIQKLEELIEAIATSGGGGGSSYSETTLWSGSESVTTDAGTSVNLSDNYTNYDALLFVVGNANVSYETVAIIPTSVIQINSAYLDEEYDYLKMGVFFTFTDSDTVTLKGVSLSGGMITTYKKIIGIKYGNGTQTFHNYSTAEQVVGTWIDGKTLYEKTVVYNGNIGHGSYATIDNSLSYSGVGFFTVLNASAKLANINTWFTYGVGGNNYDVALSDALGIYVENFSSNYDISDVIVTVRYTKTST